ncbi:DNA translocase FtsK [mine drainage metagenome]|uniref:DNA translocase FtsK n=1 Tax=mine drainage metagenome TaxID=410659 RepID=A0A1J5R5A5_9ZZZZ
MLTNRIIGRVGATVLQERLADTRQNDGSEADSAALFRLDKLSSEQIASIVREVLANVELASKIDLRIPLALVEDENLPEETLTSQNAGAVRNAGTTKVALLTANGNEHNLSDTLGHVSPLGARELRANEQAWVDATCHVAGISPTLDDRLVFKAALNGLIGASDLSLNQLGDYCGMVSKASTSHGLPIRDALGWALPCVGLPRDTSFFLNSKTYGNSVSPWRKAFEKLITNRSPLLSRMKPNGQPLDIDEMRLRLEENLDEIEDQIRVLLDAFINAPQGDDQAALEISLLEWERDGVHLIFDKPRERQQGLADSTINFFENDCEDQDVLIEIWRKHLEDLKSRERQSDWNDDDETFFELHRRYIEQDTGLHSRWEKVIYGKPIECFDFLEGLTSVTHRLVGAAGESNGQRHLRITVSKGRKEWRERFNHDVGSFFSSMYRGIKELMGEKIEWRIEKMGTRNLPDPLFNYMDYFAEEKKISGNKLKPSTSIAKTSVQIKFEVALIETQGDNEFTLEKTQLLWIYRHESIGLSLVADMKRLYEKGSIGHTEVPRRLVSKKGGMQSISLLDTGTLEATFSRDAGSLVKASSKLTNVSNDIKRRMDELASEGRISIEQRKELDAAWDNFKEDYVLAMNDFIKIGLHGEAVLRQAESFGRLLKTLLTHARGDICRSKLVSEILAIGTVRITGDQPSLIIPPWHPERMKALAVKNRRVAGLINHILSNKKVLFGDRGIFFKEFSDELAHPFYPEIAVTQRNGTPILVSESSTINGYSLLERPIRDNEDSLTDVNPHSAAKQVRELMERYVSLQPHEASNLSILLYNADAAELPLAVVRELTNMQTESEHQCNISVRHRDPAKLRRIYTELISNAGDEPNLPIISDTSENFISKLRISVIQPSSIPSRSNVGFKAFDVAFLHDVVSRTASVEWIPVAWTNQRSSLEHAPSRWSYKSVSGENELKSTTFLTCPRQTSSGWAYVGAVGAVVRQLDSPPDSFFLPARQISLQNAILKSTLDDVHAMAEWVATYDELLDKRQLQSNGITVVRYRRASTNGRNMIVSSTSELRLLGVLVRRRLGELGLPLVTTEISEVADRIKKDALSISGNIVLRAAKRGVSAGEMIGLVMSRHIIEQEFRSIIGSGQRQFFNVFFLLDDYADWLSQKESRIADILGLCVEECEEGVKLHIAVIESKYVSYSGKAEAARSSKAQLMATLTTFREALFGDPGRLDRDVWLSRLADLLLDADIPVGCSALLERARASLRDGEALISLRGYSHIFVHSNEPTSNSLKSEQLLIEEVEGVEAWQEFFERQDLRNLVESYFKNNDSSLIRSELGPARPWLSAKTMLPAQRVAWSALIDQLNILSEPTLVIESVVKPAQPITTNQEPLITKDTSGVIELEVIDNLTPASNLAKLIQEKSAGLSIQEDERQAWADDITRKLKAALNGYGLQAAVLGTRLTPNGCLVRLAGSDRLRVEDIEAKRTQLLTTHTINLVTVQPKPGEIVVTIAGSKRQSVSLWDLWARRKVNRNAAGINTSFLLGQQEINGGLLYLNLGSEFGGLSSHEPHSLVAGGTGSGKSVLIQAMLLDIAATNPIQSAQIILIDPKMGVDYSALEDLPHMREPIVVTKERANEVLSSLVDEMENRYRLFAAARARDLATYNLKAEPADRLPMVFVVHDEFADWMLDDAYKSAVSAAVQRLGVKARAAGIHLIFAAQRPDKDVMPMQLRENLGNRLILKVASEATSKIALDRPGAELLLGKGHLAAKLNGEQGLVYAQAPFLSDEDISMAVNAIIQDNL